MFFCAISGEPPQEPVISAKSGHVYERRLITKYIAENGTDPLTGEKLEEGDLLAVKANPKAAPPRPPTLTSIPALLHTLQNEWDALMLETFALKQQYNSTRQELSHALYQGDAATRVVARLIRERDSARDALARVQESMGVTPTPAPETAASDVDMATDEGGVLPADIAKEINETQEKLSSARRKRKAPASYVSVAQVRTLKPKTTISSLHSASTPGINSLAISSLPPPDGGNADEPSLFLTGGNDKIVQLYDRTAGRVLASLKGHTKKVTHVAFCETGGESINRVLLSGSADKTARIWSHDSASGEYIPRHTVKLHKGEITGLAVHPTRSLFALASADKTYSIHSLSTFQSVYQSPILTDPPPEAFTSLAAHPDGQLLAVGTTAGIVQVYDIRQGSLAASLAGEKSSGYSINTLSFSENGYQLAAPSSPSSVAIWDLRKLKTSASVPFAESFKINKLTYDTSAHYLAVAGSEGVKVLLHKTFEEVLSLDDAGDVMDAAFAGVNGLELWGVGPREVKIWGPGEN
ncbi:nuclear matrix protein [Rhizoctonia solani AG-3 Rhs1AP]|uniref:Pre-mRNA-processing factor 19 n=2 Tax=Rhizoctonia solani AG-3 TaxID=1086053 RepID=A0A074S651_9AGAM|nr:nuclear matrix protein [Rhizoctonia solani AG-3 Rhs1AP]KEP52308.1 nuclear matrix protein [Rhizoctonia solani 123E]